MLTTKITISIDTTLMPTFSGLAWWWITRFEKKQQRLRAAAPVNAAAAGKYDRNVIYRRRQR
jgi:hypothetical protein